MSDERMSEDEQQAIKTVAKGGGIVFTGLIFNNLVGYLFKMTVARLLGPSDYGLLSLGIAIAGFSTTIAVLGLHHGVQRYIPFYKAKGKLNKVKGTVLSAVKLTLISSILVSLLLFSLSGLISVNILGEPGLSSLIKIFAFSVPFNVFLLIFVSSLVGFKKMKYKVLSQNFVRNGSKLLLSVSLIFLGYGVLGAAFAVLLSYLLSSFLALYFLVFKVFPRLKERVGIDNNYHELFVYSYPLLITGVLGTIMSRTDIVMLGYFLDSYQVGIYNAALPIAVLLTMFLKPISQIIFPVISELFSEKKIDEMEKVYEVGTKWAFSLSFPALLLMIFFSKKLLTLLFGSEYSQASVALSILAVAYFSYTLVGPTDRILKTIGKTKIILANTLMAGVINVLLNVILIPQFGVVGAALATGTSLVSLQVLMLFESYYFLGIHPYKLSFYKPAIAALFSTSATYLIFDSIFNPVPVWALVIAFLVFSFLYTLLLLLMRGLDEEDILILRAIEDKSGIRIKWLRDLIKRFI